MKNIYCKRVFVIFGLIFLSLFFKGICYEAIEQQEYSVPESCKTPLKSQGNSGACWAYAGIAALETYLAKNHIFTGSLSEQHLIDWSCRQDNGFGWNIGPNRGGTSITVTGYLLSSMGPKYEAVYPSPYSGINRGNNMGDPNIRVTGIKYIEVSGDMESNIKNVKKAVLEYGAVATGYGDVHSGHAVTIVGWNDKSRTWIVKDSLTRSYRNLSYYTRGLLTSCINYSITAVEERISGEKIYQHDFFASTTNVSHSNRGHIGSFANVFNFSNQESLDSVIFKTDCSGGRYTISYAPVEGGIPTHDRTRFIDLKTGDIPYSGYIFAKLQRRFNLPQGDGAIVVTIDNGRNLNMARIGCESHFLELRVNQVRGRSFFIGDNCVTDILSYNNLLNEGTSTLTIKAITVHR